MSTTRKVISRATKAFVVSAMALGAVAFSTVAVTPSAEATANTVREDSSDLPVVYAGGAIDTPILSAGIKKRVEDAGMTFYDWSPLVTSTESDEIYLFDHLEKYMPSLDAIVNKALAESGKDKVNLITYSQGGAIAAGWLRDFDGAARVDKVANISGLSNGSPIAGIGTKLTKDCLGFGTCQDFVPEGDYIKKIQTPNSAFEGIEYLNIESRADVFAFPYTNGLMVGEGDYQNILIEDYCPEQLSGHILLPQKPAVQLSIIQFFRGEEIAPDCSVR